MSISQHLKEKMTEVGIIFDEERPNRVVHATIETLEKLVKSIAEDCANTCDLLLDSAISSEWARGTHACSKEIKKLYEIGGSNNE